MAKLQHTPHPSSVDRAANPESHWFGHEPVQPHEKTQRVLGVFDSVAERYDVMNDVMSGGLHRLWKDHLIRRVRPRPCGAYLDLAGGTGDIAFRMHRATRGQAQITVCDINPAMLAVGRRRALDRGIVDGIDFVDGNAEQLPFADHCFDAVTIAFGLRNVTRIDQGLREVYRVLRPGGLFYCLEFSTINDALLRRLYTLYAGRVIPRMGEWIARDRSSYQYLVESIERFPAAPELAVRLTGAGFVNVRFDRLYAGVVALHEGLKS